MSIHESNGDRLVEGSFIKDLVDNYQNWKGNWEYSRPITGGFDTQSVRFKSKRES